jgi:integrase
MARPRDPWFRTANATWYVEVDKKQRKLYQEPSGRRTVEGRDRARAAYQELLAWLGQESTSASGEGGVEVGPRLLLVSSLLDKYLAVRKTGLSERTWDERRRLLQKFLWWCGEHRPPLVLVRELRPLHLVEFIGDNPGWRSRDTRAEVAKVLKACFGWAYAVGISGPCPFTGKECTFTFGNRRRPMTREEFDRLIAACGVGLRSLRRILVFCYETGSRPGEARLARWADLDWEREEIVLRHHKTERTAKGPRRIRLTQRVVDLLLEQRRERPGAEYIFTNRLGRPYGRNGMAQNLRRLRRRIGLSEGVVLYGTRHGFGLRMALADVNLAVVAELMGHVPGSPVTAHYVDLADQATHLREVLERVNRGEDGNDGGTSTSASSPPSPPSS